MHGWTTTIFLLTIATVLDDILHLAHILSSERSLTAHHVHSSSLPLSSFRWSPCLTVAASPVGGSNQHFMHNTDSISSTEAQEEETDATGDAHVSESTFVGEHDDEPLGSNAPMGWADPRLRGGQMLDVGPSLHNRFSRR